MKTRQHSIHTHCQVTQKPATLAKTCQRVCMPQRTEKARKPNNV